MVITANEQEFVQGCVSNKPWAQKELYHKYCKKMMGLCLRYTGKKEEAEDLLQEGFVKVFRNISQFKGEGSLEGWIRRIILNTVFEHHRKKKLQVFSVEPYEMKEEYHPEAESVFARLSAGELMTLVQSMPEGYRTVFNLFAIDGYTHEEIGEMLGISEGTSKSQYSRARAMLQKLVVKAK